MPRSPAQDTPIESRLSTSVIIPVYLGGEHFQRCLVSVMGCVPAPTEVIVALDGPDARARELAEHAGATVVELPVQAGRSAARNLGARQACSEVLFFVDADVVVPPDAVGQVVVAFDEEPELAAVFGSYDDAPEAPGFVSQYRNLLHHYVHQTARTEASTFWAGCGAVRRGAFLSVGGFDEMQQTMEDVELGYRLRRAGHRICLRSSLQVKHLKQWTARSMLRADLFERAVPWATLILREGRFVNDLNTSIAGRLSVVCAYTLVGSLLGMRRWPALGLLAAVLALGLLLLNAPLYHFLWRKRGAWFALASIPWHWSYFLYSGLGFAIAALRHMLSQDQRSAAAETGTEMEALASRRKRSSS